MIHAAEQALAEQQHVSVLDIVYRLGWIHPGLSTQTIRDEQGRPVRDPDTTSYVQ